MTKYILTLLATLVLNLTAFSQVNTDTSVIKIPYPIAKKIAFDLVSYDSVREVLTVTQKILESTKKNSIFKDSVIAAGVRDNEAYSSQIKLYMNKDDLYHNQIEKLISENRRLRLTGKLTTGVAIISVSYILIDALLMKSKK